MQHGHVGLIVRYHFVSRLVSASHVETPALIRDQLQVRLDNYRVEVLDTSVVLRTKIRVITDANKFPSPPLFSIIQLLYIARGETKAFFRTFLRRVSTRSIIQLRKSGIEPLKMVFARHWERKSGGKDSNPEVLIWKTRIVRTEKVPTKIRARKDRELSNKHWYLS